MSEIERIQRDLDAGYTVTRYGTTKALHKQMLNDIKYLNDLAKDNEVLGDVSCEPRWYPTPQQDETPEAEWLFITKDNKVLDIDGNEADIKPIKINSCS